MENRDSSRRRLQLRPPHLELALKQAVFDEGACRLSRTGLGWPVKPPTMNQPSKTPGICRIDQPEKRTHGFFLRAARQREIYSAFFPDKKWGGRAEALAAAVEYRRKLLNLLGRPAHPSRRYWAETVRRRGRSGICGVRRVVNRRSKPWLKYWQASWSPKPGVVRKKTFSIRKFGEAKARQLAIRARRAGVRSMVD